jgi:hypothetical protein
MQPNDLELYTSQELIRELMRRKTFQGVVVHSREELKAQTWNDERVFTVHYNSNFHPAEVGRLLRVIAASVEHPHE